MAHDPVAPDRRRTLQWVAAALGAGGLGLGTRAGAAAGASGAAAAPGASGLPPLPRGPGYGTDPDLLRDYRPGDVWPLTFNARQREVAAVLCDLVIPADGRSPSASAVGVVGFIDEWVSAPYARQQADRVPVLDCLDALEQAAQAQHGGPYATLAAPAQVALFTQHAGFQKLRGLVCAGFYSTPEGARDLQYMGNSPSVQFAGPSPTVQRAAGYAPVADEAGEAGWISLFDGHTLEGWQASDAPGTFSVVHGELVAHGARSHLFYTGPVAGHEFRDFEFEAEVMTRPGANSGVYFHTRFQPTGWPSQGYEVQVNNSHADPKRTAGLYGVADNFVAPAADNQWFLLSIRVLGKRVTTQVNGRVICDYTEPEGVQRPPEFSGRLLGSGTFALQGHDPGSETHYRNLRVRLLPR
ncbi:MAG: hypothetical protein RL684_938 [Pseudomonadota bacterium]|jgi:hypothetical protein